ncbi:SEC14-like protein 2 [Seminavis robusta]|uniref:SEC14-like protein 2 n=1 Tax=Seminavis robusta TaxID=568900 RepID=A0A9N8HR42_9STRA|nr:SEC14-like protein 2 [Seminavis robusta]|eukprot:Sro1521_g279500.1 SEC14-like protein 2 (334) ;mRNA; f:20009-21234
MGKVMKSTVPSLSESFNYNQVIPGSWSQDNLEKACQAWSLKPKEVDQLKSLRDNLSDLPYWKNEPHHVLWFMKGPLGFSPSSVEHHIRKMVNWRIENDIDSLLHRYEPHPVMVQNTVSAILNDCDRDGDPIYCERGGAMDATRVLKTVGKEEMIKHAIWIRELHMRGPWAEDFNRKNGHPPKAITIVYDMEGLSAPVKRMIIIRAPALFRVAWSIVKHIFPASARKKMVFTNSNNYLDVLDQYIDVDLLPPCINPNGHGRTAPGMPRLIGEEPLELESDATETMTDDSEDGISHEQSQGITGKLIAYGYYLVEPEAGILDECQYHVGSVKSAL